MAFTRRFLGPPTTAQATAIEGVNVVELSSGGNVLEVLEGIVVGVGECLQGPYGKTAGPVEFQANSLDDFENQFGTYSPYLGVSTYGSATTTPTQGGTNGNLFCAFRGKTFVQNMVSRVDLRCQNATAASGETADPASVTCTLASAAPNVTYTIPAGTRVAATSIFVPSTTSGSGVQWTVATPGMAISIIQLAPSGGSTSAAIVTTTGNVVITITPMASETNTGVIAAIASTVAAYMTGVVVGTGSDVVVAFAYGSTAVVMPDNPIVITTNGSGNGSATFNCTNVSGLFPGQPKLNIPANNGSSATTWAIIDTQSLPAFGVATSSNATVAAGLSVYTALTTSNTTVTSTTVIYPYAAPSGTTPLDAYSSAYALAIQACDTAVTPGSTADLIFGAFVDPDVAIAGTVVGQAKWAAGQMSSNILAHLQSFRSHGKGRVGVIMGQPGDSVTAAIANTNKSLLHSPWLIYAFPWVQQSIPEANAVLNVQPNAWVACAMANVNPEENPGQVGLPAIQAIQGFESDISPPQVGDYINLKAAGIAAFFISPQTGVEIESGVTTDITLFTTIKNQRFRDFLEDTLAGYVFQYVKQLQTQERRNNLVGKIQSYLSGLLSQEDPTQQRIAAYNVDAVSGNTVANIGLGIYVVKVSVQQIDDFRNISLEMEVGENVQISSQ